MYENIEIRLWLKINTWVSIHESTLGFENKFICPSIHKSRMLIQILILNKKRTKLTAIGTKILKLQIVEEEPKAWAWDIIRT